MKPERLVVGSQGGQVSYVSLDPTAVLDRAVEEFMRAATRHLDGLMIDADIERLTEAGAVARLLLLTSIEIRRTPLDEDYGRVFHDDH